MYLGIVPYDQAITLTQKTVSNGKEVEISYTDSVTNGDMSASLYKGVVDANTNGTAIDFLYKDKSCRVKKNGTYTLKIQFMPTVKGIKNNGTYNRRLYFTQRIKMELRA